MSSRVIAGLIGLTAGLGASGQWATLVSADTEMELQSSVFRAKPAVVMVVAQVEATTTVRCATGEPRRAR
jgi:hypothetical protein